MIPRMNGRGSAPPSTWSLWPEPPLEPRFSLRRAMGANLPDGAPPRPRPSGQAAAAGPGRGTERHKT